MSRRDSDRVEDHFSACSRELTLAAAHCAAHVIFAPLVLETEVSRHCASVLSGVEMQRAERFAAESDKARFKQRRAFRRFCGASALRFDIGRSKLLSQIDFEETETGRPYLPSLPDVCFSFSSCRSGFLGAWSSTHGIGVDIEDRTTNVGAADLADWYFSEAEATAVKEVDGLIRLRTFLQLWCLKEAALKSIGKGLPFGLDSFAFDLAPRLRVVHAPRASGGPAQFVPHMIEGTGGCAALVMHRRC